MRKGVFRRGNVVCNIGKKPREPGVDSSFLTFYFGVGHLELVAQRDDGPRFHVERSSAGARPMDDSVEALVRIHTHRKYESSFPLCVVLVLKRGTVALHDVVELVKQALPRCLSLLPKLAQTWRCVVAQRSIRFETSLNLLGDGVESWICEAGSKQQRDLLGARSQKPAQHTRLRQQVNGREEFLRSKDTPHTQSLKGRREHRRRIVWKRFPTLQQLVGFRDLTQRTNDILAVETEGQLQCTSPPQRSWRPVSNSQQQTVPFQIRTGFV
jgi:hypothetical protein